MNRRHLIFAATGLLLARPARAAAVTHSVLGQDRGHLSLINGKGTVAWRTPCPGTAHDLHLLPSGNILTQTSAQNIVEMIPKGEVVWEYRARPKPGYDGAVEIHAFQPLPDDTLMIAESGNRRILEVTRDGKIVKDIPLTVDKPHPHRDTRMARKLKNGNYLVCHESDGMVREYDATGKVVWSYALDLNNQPRTPGHDGHGTEVFGAIRRANGNTLIAGGNNNRVMEVDRKGSVVWSIERDELPGIRLFWVTTLQELPNGNLVVGNCHAGPENPQLFEVTRDKKVVWTFKNWDIFGNNLAVAQITDVSGVNR
ncbi:MAG: PQQ-like beta-propeller repeat protein [Armatimonadaceae bacterium]